MICTADRKRWFGVTASPSVWYVGKFNLTLSTCVQAVLRSTAAKSRAMAPSWRRGGAEVPAAALVAPPRSRVHAAVAAIVRRLGRFMCPSPWWSWEGLEGNRPYGANVNGGRPPCNSRQRATDPITSPLARRRPGSGVAERRQTCEAMNALGAHGGRGSPCASEALS